MRTVSRLVAATAVGLVSATCVVAQDDSAIWSSGGFTSQETGETTHSLTYGVPETDAVAFDAGCKAGRPEQVDIMLFVDYGDRADGAPVIATFESEGFNATYPAAVRVLSSEYAGVEVQVSVNDPLWLVMTSGNQLSFRSVEPGTVTVPLTDAADDVEGFLEACRTGSAAEPDGEVFTQAYVCEDGSRMEATFNNSQSYSVALVTHDAMKSDIVSEKVPLIETVSGSGVLYSNGDYSLHTKADDAVLMRGETTYTCRAE